MNHINYGTGKGKTTAALGLALRMIGHGKRVLYVSFLKDGTSGEVNALQQFNNVKILYKAMPEKFLFQLPEKEKEAVMREQCALYEEARVCFAQYDLIILDEILDVLALDILKEEWVISDLETYRNQEIICTGRTPSKDLMERADYLIEFSAHRHPFEKGIAARQGVEF